MHLKTYPILRRAGWRLGASALVLAAASLLAACGGGSEQPGADAVAAKSTALYFTDDFSAEHEAVWISVTQVTVVSPSGQTQVATFDPPRLINLPTLKRAGSLFASAQIPADATALRVYVGTTARLQKLDGTLLDVTLAAPGGILEFPLEGWKADSGVLALDFDLPRFQLQGQVLTPAVRVAGENDFAQWNDRDAEVRGTVSAASGTALTLQSGSLGARTFVLDAQTSFISARGAGWRPAVGDRVEVYGKVSGQGSQDLQFLARVVKDRSDAASAALVEVKGKVSALNGTLVTLDIDRSQAGGPVGSLSVDLASARFERGSLGLVQPGTRLELHLAPAGTGWTARVVEVDGAPRPASASDSAVENTLTEVKARVVSVAGSLVELTPFKIEGPTGTWVSGPLRADVTGAYFERSALSCLLPNTAVEMKGRFDAAGVLIVTKVEGEGACAAASPVAGVKPSDDDPSAPSAGVVFVEAQGNITAVRPGEFDLQLFRVEGAAITAASVTVRHDAATVFDGLDPMALVVGTFVEVKGLYAAGVIDAGKVERD